MEIDRLLELMRRRVSCRSYLDKPVEDNKIRNCLEAARLAPSACNKQPWRFKIITERPVLDRICDEGLRPGLPMPWLKQAPLIAVLCAKKDFITHSFAPMLSKVKYHLIDIGIAGEHFVLAAEAQQLGTCWIGWFNPKRIRKIAGIPHNLKILSLISVGYPAETKEQPEKLPVEGIML